MSSGPTLGLMVSARADPDIIRSANKIVTVLFIAPPIPALVQFDLGLCFDVASYGEPPKSGDKEPRRHRGQINTRGPSRKSLLPYRCDEQDNEDRVKRG